MSGDQAGGGPRRFLIAAAVAAHDEAPDWDRPALEAAREQVVSLFTDRFGYTLLDTVGMNPSAVELLDALDDFSRGPDRRFDDILAVYFTGHGERLEGTDEYVLFTTDTVRRPHRALTTDLLARVLLFRSKVRRLLLMLDTCYSGQGAADFASAALDRYTRHWRNDTDTGTDVASQPTRGVALISSSQPWQQTRAGLFPDLLTSSVDSLATAGYAPEVVTVASLVGGMNARLRERGQRTSQRHPGQQRIVWDFLRAVGDLPPFLPNPRHDRGLTEVDLNIQRAREWEAHAERRDIEFRTRLLRHAMGNREGKGWWFCGRHTALTDITRWLTDPDPHRPLLAVTGDPGSGKTAVLGLIAALTRPDYRRTVPVNSLDLPPEAIPTEETVDVAIYAQNLTADQVRDGIAAALEARVDTTGELVTALNTRAGVFTVLLDGLDEAIDPHQLIRELLQPLLQHAREHVRLLVGTRPYLLEQFATDRDHEIDLDNDRYADPEALTAYTIRNLLEADLDSPYLNAPRETTRAVAEAVAEQASPSFLVARIVAATLAADPVLPNPHDPIWRAGLPALPADAMHHDLASRLGDAAERARDLLRPLAFAQGQGLPWEDLWAPIASALAGTVYTDEDLLWLRRNAGSYVVEATENDRSVYRLYHKSLAEYLARDQDPATVHATIVRVLRQRVPPGLDGGRDWARAHPYTLRHVATHAAHAGLIDELVTDMDYLVHAEPTTLLAALDNVHSDEGLLIRAVYRSAARHQHLPPRRRRQILAFDAARFGATAQQHQLNRALDWQVRWATGILVHPAHRTTIRNGREVTDLTCLEIDGRPIAVTSNRDHTVRVWDLASGTEHAVLTGHDAPVSAVACTQLNGQPVAVTSSRDHTVRVWDLASGTEHAALTGHDAPVSAVACTQLNGQPVAVTGSWDGTVQMLDLTTGEHAVFGDQSEAIRALACTQLNGRPLAVAGGWYHHTVRVWDVATGTEHAALTGHDAPVWAVACTQLNGQPVAVTGSWDGTVRMWDLATGTEQAVLTGHEAPVSAVACTQLNGRPVAVTGGWDGTVLVWDLTSGTEHAVLTGHDAPVNAVACILLNGQPIAVTASADDTMRIWNMNTPDRRALASDQRTRQAPTVAPESVDTAVLITDDPKDATRTQEPNPSITHAVLTGHDAPVNAVACTQLNGRPVAVTSSQDHTARVWDLATGTEHAVFTGHNAPVWAVTCIELKGRPVAVTGSRDGTVRVWDLATGTEHAAVSTGLGLIVEVSCIELEGRLVAFTLDDYGRARVCDLTTGEQDIIARRRGSVGWLACTQINGQPVAVIGGASGTVRVRDLTTGEHTVFGGDQSEAIRALACSQIDGRPVAVAGGSNGTVRVWDLTTGEHAVLTGHRGLIRSVACGQLNGRPVAVTSSRDHTVRIWDLRAMVALSVLDCPVQVGSVSIAASGEIVVNIGGDVAVLDH